MSFYDKSGRGLFLFRETAAGQFKCIFTNSAEKVVVMGAVGLLVERSFFGMGKAAECSLFHHAVEIAIDGYTVEFSELGAPLLKYVING